MLASCVTSIIPAAGSGSRMKSTKSKALVKVGEKTLLEHTVKALVDSGVTKEIIIVGRPKDLDSIKALQFNYDRIHIIEGGETRQESVFFGLEFAKMHIEEGAREYILIHDAARPLLTAELVRTVVMAGLEYQAVTLATPIFDTLKKVSTDGIIIDSTSRDQVWSIQTPQVFQFDLIWKAHINAPSSTNTDDASLLQTEYPVRIIPGARSNFKITTQEDLDLARKLLL